jgi:polyhydroxyalkanoate synthase
MPKAPTPVLKAQAKPMPRKIPAQNDNNSAIKAPDPAALAKALIEAYSKAQPLFKDFMERHGNTEWRIQSFDPMNLSGAYMEYIESFLKNPEKFWELHAGFWSKWAELWQESTRKFMGEDGKTIIEPDKSDRRFKAPEWQESGVFDFIKQSYLLTCEWMEKSIEDAKGLDKKKQQKLAFATKLFADALSPTNFLLTNPEVLNETMRTGGENLIRGFKNMIDDLERGRGELKISTTNYDAFQLGKNIAATPGRVVFQNDLMQLIQYEPSTDKVFKKPLLIIPPWINKYYILDLKPDNSLVKWAVDQGHTVFIVSWVNPSKDHAQKRFDDYMNEGVLGTLEEIEKITGEPDCNVIGYCLGGTLLTIALSYLKSKNQAHRIASATFLTTLVDFENSGEMKLFLDDEQLQNIDRSMAEKGVFEAKQLQQTFSLLRANDLIWSFVVNNYLMGREPFPFDLLYWNDDSTNMPAAMHSFYLRKMYRDNALIKAGGINMNNVPIDVTKIDTPAYFLSTREDHIAPWKATYATTQLLKGPITFTLAASGHIAGVVNAPAKEKYCYWTASETPTDPDQWMEAAKETKGSWWPHWQKWIENYAGEKIPARKPAKGIEAAPGSYVKVKV